MRMNVYSDKGVLERPRSGSGGTLTDFLLLITDPVIGPDAATKRYVDEKFQSLSIADITSGVIDVAQMPQVLGDATSEPGSNQVSLRTIMSPGALVKPQVNFKGLVVGSIGLDSSDIPNLSWSMVETGHPTTLSGYGIGDAISTSGGSLNVNLTLSGAPTIGSHAATKAYVDTASTSSGGGGVDVGDIMLKAVLATPAGYLQCNGATVNKVTYAALYAVMGDSYDSRIVTGAGKPWQQQYNININNQINFNSVTAGPILSSATAFGEVVVTKNRVYMLGGSNGTNINTIQTAAIASDGTIGVWSASVISLPSGMKNFQVAVTKNYLYLFSSIGSGNNSNSIYRSPIDSSGVLGNWQSDGTLPSGVSGHQVFATSSRLYIVGGSTDGGSTAVSTVHYATINGDGTLDSWTAGPSLPMSVQHARLAVTKGRVYLIGGHTGSVVLSNLVYGTIDATGVVTGWTSSITLPTSSALGHSLVTEKHVYYIGGTNNNDLTGTSSNIYRSPIQSDGSLGSWELMSGSCSVKGGNIISIRNRIVVLGGLNSAGVYLNTVTNYVTSNEGAPNDFSVYYTSAVFSNSASAEFKLPDLTFTFSPDSKYYIKY